MSLLYDPLCSSEPLRSSELSLRERLSRVPGVLGVEPSSIAGMLVFRFHDIQFFVETIAGTATFRRYLAGPTIGSAKIESFDEEIPTLLTAWAHLHHVRF